MAPVTQEINASPQIGDKVAKGDRIRLKTDPKARLIFQMKFKDLMCLYNT